MFPSFATFNANNQQAQNEHDLLERLSNYVDKFQKHGGSDPAMPGFSTK